MEPVKTLRGSISKLHRPGTARQPVNGLTTCENPEGEHLIVAKGRSSQAADIRNPPTLLAHTRNNRLRVYSPFLAPLSKHCGMVKSFVQMEIYVE
mgnify:FL=1